MRLSGVVRVGLAAYVVAYALPVVGEERGWEVAWIVFQALGDWEPVKDGLLAVWCNAANGGVLAGL